MAKKSKSKTVVASENNESPITVVSASSVEMHTLAGTSTTSSTSSVIQATGSSNSSNDTTGIRRSIKTVDSSDSVNEETVLLEHEEELPDIVVNKWSLHELKTACDDAVKQVGRLLIFSLPILADLCSLSFYQYFSKPSQFKPSHVHTDVRLTLGWTASIIALGASIYAYKVPFQQSRDWVLAAVVLYILLSGMQALYVRYIEKDTIFQGQRKVFAGRVSSIITCERIMS
jgi:signal peptidase complex subunit 2